MAVGGPLGRFLVQGVGDGGGQWLVAALTQRVLAFLDGEPGPGRGQDPVEDGLFGGWQLAAGFVPECLGRAEVDQDLAAVVLQARCGGEFFEEVGHVQLVTEGRVAAQRGAV